MKIGYVIVLCACIMHVEVYAQPYRTGCLNDTMLYKDVSLAKEQVMRAPLPAEYSLQRFCPRPKNQGDFGTCTAWATAYAARTIIEAIQYGWEDVEYITQQTFSPAFVYCQIKREDDANCQDGSYIEHALNLLKNSGVPKYVDFHPDCADGIVRGLRAKAREFKIDQYRRLFDRSYTRDAKARSVKKAISENRPVVISMWVPKSFSKQKKGCWHPVPGDSWPMTENESRWHAMCVVGYDDVKYGGSFLIMNSWGPDWGENGYTWVTYDDFAQFVVEGYELYCRPKSPENKEGEFSGEVSLSLRSGESMPLRRIRDGDNVFFSTQDVYDQGNRYRLYINSDNPVYVYVITSDDKNTVDVLFPGTSGVSAALDYKRNRIAVPDEHHVYCMGEGQGSDFLCIVFSKMELDIESVEKVILSSKGGFSKKVDEALKKYGLVSKEAFGDYGRASFEVMTQGVVLPVIIEIRHN